MQGGGGGWEEGERQGQGLNPGKPVHGNDWLYTEAVDVCVSVCFFCSAMAVRIRAFQASFTVGEIFMR